MAFNHSNAPKNFYAGDEHLMGKVVVIWLDNILIYNHIIDLLLYPLQDVLLVLCSHQYFVAFSKCVFLDDQFNFLGFAISSTKIVVDLSQIRYLEIANTYYNHDCTLLSWPWTILAMILFFILTRLWHQSYWLFEIKIKLFDYSCFSGDQNTCNNASDSSFRIYLSICAPCIYAGLSIVLSLSNHPITYFSTKLFGAKLCFNTVTMSSTQLSKLWNIGCTIYIPKWI